MRRTAASNKGKNVASYAQIAYDAIKDDIITQKLKPGAFISETEYADKLGISRTPVREALKVLEQEGLLDIFPRKGVQVKSFTLDDILQIHEAAEALESAVMGSIAERSAQGKVAPEDIAALEALLQEMDGHLKDGNMQKWLSCDHRFHNMLISLCDNPYILQYAISSRNRMNLTLWFITPKYSDKNESTSDHRAIVTAIGKGDVEGAREAARAHIHRTRKRLMEVVGL